MDSETPRYTEREQIVNTVEWICDYLLEYMTKDEIVKVQDYIISLHNDR
jgi:hypothetical protein